MSIHFRVAYRFGLLPWDSDTPPPELVSLVEGPDAPAPAKALDIGCGSGTNTVYMARHGWDVTGVDFVPRAIEIVKRKATAAGVSPRLVVGDVTRLGELGIGSGFGLLLDRGCFHSIADDRRDGYVKGVTALASPGATMLLFTLVRGPKPARMGPRGVGTGEVATRFGAGWEVASETGGGPMMSGTGTWYRLRRP